MYGNERQPVAGFCIFNDVSARDVQATEFVGGFCLTKDMAKGNQLGPYLVTPDEVGDPYNLEVTVLVNGDVKYRGYDVGDQPQGRGRVRVAGVHRADQAGLGDRFRHHSRLHWLRP